MAITYNNLYMDIRQKLHRADIDAATLEARELVAFAAGKTRQELLRDGGLYVSQEVEQRAAALVERHLAGEPLAYLIGEWSFCGMDLDINESVLIPRVDTEVLAEQAIGYVKTLPEPRVLDLCAGSGCVGLAVAKFCPGSHVVLGELMEGALRVCRQNIRRSGLTGPTDWISTAPSAKNGVPPCVPAAGCTSRWVSGRRTMCCASCALRGLAISMWCRTLRAFPVWYTAHSAKVCLIDL